MCFNIIYFTRKIIWFPKDKSSSLVFTVDWRLRDKSYGHNGYNSVIAVKNITNIS